MSAPLPKRDIVLVEDSQADISMVSFYLKQTKLNANLITFERGEEALDYLFKRGNHEKSETPDVVLLDINLPGISGIDVLKALKEDKLTRLIPVIMLAGSKDENDVLRSYQYHCNSFVQKPYDLDGLKEFFDSFNSFWLNIATLPKFKS